MRPRRAARGGGPGWTALAAAAAVGCGLGAAGCKSADPAPAPAPASPHEPAPVREVPQAGEPTRPPLGKPRAKIAPEGVPADDGGSAPDRG